jgi:hypothetical protein
MKRLALAVSAAIALSLVIALPSSAAIKAGSACKKAGLTTIDSGRKYTCVKQGKKFVWNKGVVIKAVPAKVPVPTTTPTPSATPTATPTPTPSPTPTPTFIEPVRAKSFADLVENAEGLNYWSWKLAQERKANSGKKQVEFVIDVGPNTKLNFPNPLQVFQETADFYSQYDQVKKFHAIIFDSPDLEWALALDRKYSANPRQDEVRGNCRSDAQCNGGNAYVDGTLTGFTYIASSPRFASEQIRTLGIVESHEYFHTIQFLPVITAQAKGQRVVWMPDWVREGSAQWLATSMYFTDYQSLLAYQIRDSENDLYRQRFTAADVSKVLSINDGRSDNGWLAYNIGAKVMEALVVLKGVDSILEFYVEGSKGTTFEAAFEKIYGTSWATAKPILAEAISKRYR